MIRTHRVTIEITSEESDIGDWLADCMSRNMELYEAWSMDIQEAPLNQEHVKEITARYPEG